VWGATLEQLFDGRRGGFRGHCARDKIRERHESNAEVCLVDM
jgi:hypothetical protein